MVTIPTFIQWNSAYSSSEEELTAIRSALIGRKGNWQVIMTGCGTLIFNGYGLDDRPAEYCENEITLHRMGSYSGTYHTVIVESSVCGPLQVHSHDCSNAEEHDTWVNSKLDELLT